jgi:uncharacterized protein (DUF305 family)
VLRDLRLVVVVSFAGVTAALAGIPAEDSFLAENQAAMHRMMASMHIQPSGDIDRDFVSIMVPHHQGAIDMARAELRYGHSESLRRIAQEIIIEQQQQIAAMHVAGESPANTIRSGNATAQ